MSDDFRTQVDSLIVKLDKIKNIDLNTPLARGALIIENAAKEKCPTDTGILRRSITHRVEGDEAIIYTNVEYAPYVEFGTGIFASKGDGRKTPWSYQTADGTWHTTQGQAAQPFLMPALHEKASQAQQEIKEALKKQIDKIT